LLHAVADGSYLYFIKAAGGFFTVTGYERYGCALIKQGNGSAYLFATNSKLLRYFNIIISDCEVGGI
jgi:hypothetical protein